MNRFLCLALSMLVFGIFAQGCEKKEADRPISPVSAPANFDNEIKLLKDMLREDPKNVNALIKLGNVLMDSKRCQEAVDAYGKALDIDPKNVDVRVDMGSCYRSLGMPAKAVEEYRKGIAINPNHVFAHKNLAIVLTYDLGDKQGGIKEFETALELDPNTPDAPEIRKEVERLKSQGGK